MLNELFLKIHTNIRIAPKFDNLKLQMLHLQYALHGPGYNNNGNETETSLDQYYVETTVSASFDTEIPFPRQNHINYLLAALNGLNSRFVGLDASKPWCFLYNDRLVYWILHALDLLGYTLTEELQSR